MKKQTAVEWLVNELNQKIDFIPMDKWDMIRDIVQQAKEIEREQIINAYDSATFYLKGEIYYRKTFEDESGI
jgi:hypothetical protein